jgi:hypothetical protein
MITHGSSRRTGPSCVVSSATAGSKASAAKAMARLFAAARLHPNRFQPSFEPQEVQRIGARVIERCHPPTPPAAFVLADAAVDEKSKAPLRQLLTRADPVVLSAEFRAAQAELGQGVDRRGIEAASLQPIVMDRDRLAASVQAEIRTRLDADPTISALEVRTRLEANDPERFADKHQRTVQRCVKAWRSDQARRIVLAGIAAIVAGIHAPSSHLPAPTAPA